MFLDISDWLAERMEWLCANIRRQEQITLATNLEDRLQSRQWWLISLFDGTQWDDDTAGQIAENLGLDIYHQRNSSAVDPEKIEAGHLRFLLRPPRSGKRHALAFDALIVSPDGVGIVCEPAS